ncbi:MAG: hypothetical protein ACI4JM_11255 [Oscillospiraceae bacterium]
MNINISLLTESMESIVEYLKSRNLNTVELIDDYYLDFQDVKFEIEKKSAEELKKADVCIGSLYDDVIEIAHDIEKDSDGINVVSTVTIDRLAHILEYLSYYINKQIQNSISDDPES